MVAPAVWNGIDRLSFHENAVLLELKQRSQAKEPLKLGQESDCEPLTSHNSVLSAQEARVFLDDFALVAAGPGGADNFSAACFENEESSTTATIRAARNAGISSDVLRDLRSLVSKWVESAKAGSSVT